jgi:gamma-glutamyltranspeptidase/glutathione hydrolase
MERNRYMDNMVVCPEPLAAKVGREVFAKNGNAVDAAVATAFAQAVTNPLMCGLGGTGLWNYYDAKSGGNLILNSEVSIGSRPVPAGWTDKYAGRSETIGRYIIDSEANQVGYRSVMTPGFVRGCWEAYRRFGSGCISWSGLLAPAVHLAEAGFEVYPYIAGLWRKDSAKPGYPDMMTKFKTAKNTGRHYLKSDGSVYDEGDRLMQPVLANTIRRLSETGGDDFYEGEIARALSEDFAQHGGFITPEDLRDYAVIDQQPLNGRYRGLAVSSAPHSGGAQIIQMLHVLEHFSLSKIGFNTPEYIDLFSRIQRATFVDSAKLKGLDMEQAGPLQTKIISSERAAYWADRIKREDRIVVRGGAVDSGTTHLTCVDAQRNVVSFTHSIGSLAGSGVATPELGFLHNNFLGHFNPLPGRPDSIAPGKRLSGVAPTILFKDGKPYLALGAPGGSRIITSVVQTIANVIDHGMDMRTAVSTPRFHSEEAQTVNLEPQFPENTAEFLRAMGNDVQRSTYMSRVQAILVRTDTDVLEAGADPRGGAGIGRHPEI